MILRTYYPTIVVSDLHWGTSHSKAVELANFLGSVNCGKLILNGDIIDGWHFRRRNCKRWKHTDFFKTIMKMVKNCGTEVIYVRGNHDDFLDYFAPMSFCNIHIVKDYVHESHGKRYYVTHGDVFDMVATHMVWLARLGDVGYTFLLWLNEMYNRFRSKRGLPYHSLSQTIKQRVKSAVSSLSGFEEKLVELARRFDCSGVICGHTHRPENAYYRGIHYLNSGDWVESLTALLEDEDGHWSIFHYRDICTPDGKATKPDLLACSVS